MNFKPPQFWQESNSIFSWLLWPISLIYGAISRLIYYTQIPKKFNTPIICIGNSTIGGSGKTPVAIAIAKFLISQNYSVVFACRNYRAKITTPTIITKQHHSPDVIDEALLLVQTAPTVIAGSRFAAVEFANSLKPDVIIVDDGLQNNSFVKDLVILVIDPKIAAQNQFVLPAGPYREPMLTTIQKSHMLCVIEEKQNNNYKKFALPILQTHREYLLPEKPEGSYLAFTGIAYPDKFFASLKEKQFIVKKHLTFADHQSFSLAMIEKILSTAKNLGLKIITTEKDLVKIPKKYHPHIQCLKLQIVIENSNLILKHLDKNS